MAYQADLRVKTEALEHEAKEHDSIINNLNDKLARTAPRVRIKSCSSINGLPTSPATTTSGNGATSGTGFTDNGHPSVIRLVERVKQYEQINVALRACQGYISAVQQAQVRRTLK